MPKIVPVVAPAPPVFKILRETFRATSDPSPVVYGNRITQGVVTVEYADAVIEAHASLHDDKLGGNRGSLYVHGFVARCKTGKKIWRVRVGQMAPDEEPYINFAHMNHTDSRRKNATIWYAPKLWANACE